jgi:hypothetical protein
MLHRTILAPIAAAIAQAMPPVMLVVYEVTQNPPLTLFKSQQIGIREVPQK